MSSEHHLLAITACPSGVAHTYMAAENLERAAQKLGYTMSVETHGSIGVEGTFTDEDIRRAEAVIIAADSKVDLERFGGKRVVVTGVSEGIHHPEDLIKRGLAATPLAASGGQGDRPRAAQPTRGIYPILMNGVSHMIPFVVVGGLMLAVAFGIGGVPGPGGLEIPKGSVFETLKDVGALGFTLMVPILSGFIAYAIADRPGLAPGMITGSLAVSPAIYHSESGAGFLGGIVTGLLSGYLALGIKKIPVHKYVAPIWPIIVIPVVTTTVIGALFIYVLGSPIANVFTGLTTWLSGMQGTSAVLLGMILGLMTGFDLGGPVNKVAYLFAGGLIATGNFYPAGMNGVAVAVPPIGMGIASLVSRRHFDDSERQSGIAALFMGFFGITEGAIPFAASRPLQVIPANMIGSAVGAGLAGFLAVQCQVMWGGPIVAVVGGVGQPLLFALCLLVGSATTAVIALSLIAVSSRRGEVIAERTVAAEPAGKAPEAGPSQPPSASGGAVATAVRQATVLEYISEETILLDPTATNRDAMIAELVALGVRTGQITDEAVVLASALAREELMSTAVGEGIAIPHAKSDGAARPMVAFARTRGLDWSSPSGDLANLVFLISVPAADAGEEHLRILAKLSRALTHQEVRQALLEATTKKQVLDALRSAVD